MKRQAKSNQILFIFMYIIAQFLTQVQYFLGAQLMLYAFGWQYSWLEWSLALVIICSAWVQHVLIVHYAVCSLSLSLSFSPYMSNYHNPITYALYSEFRGETKKKCGYKNGDIILPTCSLCLFRILHFYLTVKSKYLLFLVYTSTNPSWRGNTNEIAWLPHKKRKDKKEKKKLRSC